VVKVISRQGSSAAADGRFNRIRQMAPTCPPTRAR